MFNNFLKFEFLILVYFIVSMFRIKSDSYSKNKQSLNDLKHNNSDIQLYKNLSSNYKDQEEILIKIETRLKNKIIEVDNLQKQIKQLQSSNIEKNQISLYNKFTNNNKRNNTEILLETNFSYKCNKRNECVNIIDIDDFFLINTGNKNFNNFEPKRKNEKIIIFQNDVFQIKGIFDIFFSTNINNKIEDFRDENIIDFHFIDVKSFITKYPQIFSDYVFKFNNHNIMNQLYIILILTNQSIKIIDKDFNLIEIYSFDYINPIIKADFSYFDEDDSIILISQDFIIYEISLKFEINSLFYKLKLIEEFSKNGEKLNVIFLD